MAVDSPFTITYGSRAVGGTSDTYQLHEPYVIEKSFAALSVSFDVVVVATSYATLKTLSDALEVDFRKRDQTLVIDLDGSAWTYTHGTDIFNTVASISKTGDKLSDRGVSRSYTCTIEAELPADDASPVSGLRDLVWNVTVEASRQQSVAMTGIYTATKTPAQLATVNYKHANGADAEASTFLTALKGAASFELVNESFIEDRNNHTCEFARVYVELLANQSAASLDDTDIRDHNLRFADVTAHPGDSQPDIHRLRRILGNYDCAIDIDQTTNLQTVFDSKVKPHLLALFQRDYTPQVFCIEDRTVSYDETRKRMVVQITFLYQGAESEQLVEVTSSVSIREIRTPDFTYMHNDDEFAALVDIGWAIRERTATRTATVLGDEDPKKRMGEPGEEGFSRGLGFSHSGGHGGVTVVKKPVNTKGGFGVGPGGSGGRWITMSNDSNATPLFIGDPREEQIVASVLTETVVERFVTNPRFRQKTKFPGAAAK